MSAELARRVRANRERQMHKEELLHLARETKLLADRAFTLDEHRIGAKLLDCVEYIRQTVKGREW